MFRSIPPLAVTGIVALAMGGLSFTVPIPVPIPAPARWVVAGLLGLLGAGIALVGVVQFRRHKTTMNPFTPEQSSTLVTSGVYRWSRNPMYLGFLLLLLGWGAWLANGAALFLIPGFVVYMNRFQIGPEEVALRRHFGAPFDQYCATVRRWI
jgi:protein-S-isoprenylcysteine O-methyltransferase Ste14